MTECCPYRDRCMVPIGRWSKRGSRAEWVRQLVRRSTLPFPCGFEMAGTVKGCPKAQQLSEQKEERGCQETQNVLAEGVLQNDKTV